MLKNQSNKMKYTGKSLTVNVTELFTGDLGALQGLEYCSLLSGLSVSSGGSASGGAETAGSTTSGSA